MRSGGGLVARGRCEGLPRMRSGTGCAFPASTSECGRGPRAYRRVLHRARLVLSNYWLAVHSFEFSGVLVGQVPCSPSGRRHRGVLRMAAGGCWRFVVVPGLAHDLRDLVRRSVTEVCERSSTTCIRRAPRQARGRSTTGLIFSYTRAPHLRGSEAPLASERKDTPSAPFLVS